MQLLLVLILVLQCTAVMGVVLPNPAEPVARLLWVATINISLHSNVLKCTKPEFNELCMGYIAVHCDK